ncbi:MAG TPA: glucose-6-phosphate dehydrogenase [Candidatus Hydrogenedentes bacterium]|nr:glucose-6-phosphate dehydrogenase [Candidatus Hydrogenedentota bacterium]HPG69163.1 glucose-6-phosphate dehydrogenase [Candidatus Hydrogenedentota bacterium]
MATDHVPPHVTHHEPISIVVIGASGDLAIKKIYPALFALHARGFLDERCQIVGFARSPYTDGAFRARLAERLTCRYHPDSNCAALVASFLDRCTYVQGAYDSKEAFLDLYAAMRSIEGGGRANRVFYMAIPSFLFANVAKAIGDAGLVSCDPVPGWTRVVLEKPFGRDRASSDALTARMASIFTESQTFRIDHYLGKEAIQNLLVLRFANLVFDPVWNAAHVDHVRIAWGEDFGVEERAGYFDHYGIIRDVMQNHLLQMLALVAMERPARLDARHIRDEKVRVLRRVSPVCTADMVLGQYAAASFAGRRHVAYTAEPGVPADSRTPTYAAAVLRVDTPRWQGVPFLLTAGKALDMRKTEIRVVFRPVSDNLFCAEGDSGPCLPPNELILRIQPDEAIALRVVNRAPGLDTTLVESELDLRYSAAFPTVIPDAYECLLLDVIRGDKGLFLRSDELEAAWDIFTPALHAIDERAVVPEPYPFGGPPPSGLAELALRHGIAL